MKPFGYWRDPLFLAGCALYALNRWVLKPRVPAAFLHDHFNDLLLIPCALPLLLWLQRRAGLRQHDVPPTASEIGFHVIVWAVLFELIGPYLMRVTGDVWDVVAYAIGGLGAWAWWQWQTVKEFKSHEL